MKERDSELDDILKPLAQTQPTPEQMKRWKSLVRKKSPRKIWFERALSLGAAAVIGFIVGVYWTHTVGPQTTTEVASNFDNTATIESVYVKSGY